MDVDTVVPCPQWTIRRTATGQAYDEDLAQRKQWFWPCALLIQQAHYPILCLMTLSHL